MRHFTAITTLVIALMLASDRAMACATCYGAEGDPQTKGLNAAIITLLGVTYTLFTGMAVTAFVYWKKNRTLPGDAADPADPSDRPALEEDPTAHG